MVMTREEKIEYMLNDLAQRGVKKYRAAPPLYRALWPLDFDITPPLFGGFWSNALILGVFFAVFWGVIMSLVVWRDQPMILTITASIIAGIFFGLFIAAYYRRLSRKLGLPKWQDYPSAFGQRSPLAGSDIPTR